NLISAYILESKNASGSSESGSSTNKKALRYGENPHQKAWFEGNLEEVFEQIQGKELSYNNLVDIDAALGLVDEFTDPAVCIIKHTNPCGVATGENLADAYRRAFEADTVSAFGGIIAFNRKVDVETATELDKLFFEVCTAPEYEQEALDILTRKKNRMILKVKNLKRPELHSKTILNGLLVQDQDSKVETEADFTYATEQKPTEQQIDDLLFANKIAKHAKSNTIVLAKNRQLRGIGVGQTSRVDALEQAIDKAKRFNLSVDGAAMASDAFFPFPDCVEIAHKAGISSVIHPGGSIRDKDSIDYCNQNGMAMVLTGFRHFKH
ncbi:MAG: bifunctional phosphoribosylaminoimidazolecarboxamide formyltransferase/IMP cyclohydrolase, partial [Sphingobacteriales bacterium]